MEAPQLIKRHRTFAGWTEFYAHTSTSTETPMRFSVYLPPQATTQPVPVVYWLSGLTCTEENFMAKAGAQEHAARLGLMLVAPDTSPRGAEIPGENTSYDFGTGAGFYVNATQPPWSRNYRMYDYIQDELPRLIERHFPAHPTKRAITGHSMGGHGALVLALRNPDRYVSASAFAPIAAPSQSPWGEKAFRGYLGDDRAAWLAYDATALMATTSWRKPTLIDQGTADEYLHDQLKPDQLAHAARTAGVPLELRLQSGYDHSYYFIASFIGEHLAFHARQLT